MHVFFYFFSFFFFSKLIWRVQSDITCHYTRNFMSSWQPYNKISTVHVLEIKFNLFSVFVIYFCDLFVCLFVCLFFVFFYLGWEHKRIISPRAITILVVMGRGSHWSKKTKLKAGSENGPNILTWSRRRDAFRGSTCKTSVAFKSR